LKFFVVNEIFLYELARKVGYMLLFGLTRFIGGLDMSHSLDYNIREQLADYLAGKISLREFEDWVFSETWDIDEIDNTDDRTPVDLVYGIKLRLAEFSHGDWTEAELHSMLCS
jgi:hypothetical protein